MVAKNIIAPVIEQSKYNGVELLSKTKTNYLDFGNNIVKPNSIQVSKSSNSLEEKIKYHSYYPNGNVKEVSKTDGTHIVYIWGYKDEYPIAMIENAIYTEVSSQVANLQSKSDLDNDRVVDAINSDGTINYQGNEGALRSALASFRNSLPNAMVTTYTYDPLIGVTSMTDPKGYTIYYEYDSFNRLKQVKDKDGKIVSANNYHYKGQ